MDANSHHQSTFGKTSRPTPTKLSSINPFVSDNANHGQAVNTGTGKKTSPISRHESPINSSSSGSGSLFVNDCGVDANLGRNAFEAYIEALVTQKVESIMQEMLRSGKISINDTTKETKSTKSPAFEAFTLNSDNKKNVYQPPAKRGIYDWHEKVRNTPIKANNKISNQQQEQVAPTNAIATANANVPSPLSIEVKAYPRSVFDEVYERRPEKVWVEYAIKKCKYFDDLFDRLILFDIG